MAEKRGFKEIGALIFGGGAGPRKGAPETIAEEGDTSTSDDDVVSTAEGAMDVLIESIKDGDKRGALAAFKMLHDLAPDLPDDLGEQAETMAELSADED